MPDGEGAWEGYVTARGVRIDVKLKLPLRFPDVLPEVYVSRPTLPRQVPHVERNGKVCVAPSTGVLLDGSQPEGLVDAVLERASQVLERGLTGQNQDDLQAEFLAYWGGPEGDYVLSICAPDGPPRRVALLTLLGSGPLGRSNHELLADSRQQGDAWAEAVGVQVGRVSPSIFIPLRSPIAPPEYEKQLTVADVVQIAREHSSDETRTWLEAELRRPGEADNAVFSFPAGTDKVVFAVRMPRPDTRARREAQRGFRPIRTPWARVLKALGARSVTRLTVKRLDSGYLAPRGGAERSMQAKTALVAGCGAVGSRVAECLASLGIGRLVLIDPELFAAENVHRHLLGVRSIGAPKVEACASELKARFPHVEVETRSKLIDDVLESEPSVVTSVDAVVLATGDPTIELRLNDHLRNSNLRVHLWVEPLGLGGHAAAFGPGSQPGCFRCLFPGDPDIGLYNVASFAAPGQDFGRSFAGCGGIFVPFAGLDAMRTALEGARLVAGLLGGTMATPSLLSWFGDSKEFISQGFRLSRRAGLFRPGDTKWEHAIARSECASCSSSRR